MLSKFITILLLVFSFSSQAAVLGEKMKFECGTDSARKTVIYDVDVVSAKMLQAAQTTGGYGVFVDQDRNTYEVPTGKKFIVDCIWFRDATASGINGAVWTADNNGAPGTPTGMTAQWDSTNPPSNSYLLLWEPDADGASPNILARAADTAVSNKPRIVPFFGLQITTASIFGVLNDTGTGDIYATAFGREVDIDFVGF